MKKLFLGASVLLFLNGVACFIIPDEIPSLLSVIYSNIPIIKKGTDSRIGWGFRLGDRADFQFLVELGPQKYTQPLANEPDKTVSNKRNTLNDLASQLWAQRQEDKRKQQQKLNTQDTKTNDANSWLQNWSSEVQNRDPSAIPAEVLSKAKPGLAIGEIDAKSVIPADDDLQGSRNDYSRSIKTQKSEEIVISTTTKSSENDSSTSGTTSDSASSTKKAEESENDVK